jgi:predicted TIM-barrel fold metal-dependent hydrolase
VIQNANTLLKDRILFGSDFPVFDPDRWMSEFADADFRDDVRPGILRENAARLLGIDLEACAPGSPISFI